MRVFRQGACRPERYFLPLLPAGVPRLWKLLLTSQEHSTHKRLITLLKWECRVTAVTESPLTIVLHATAAAPEARQLAKGTDRVRPIISL